MKKSLFIIMTLAIFSTAEDAFKSVWQPIPGYTLWDIYTNGGSEQDLKKRETKMLSSSSSKIGRAHV